MWLKRLLSLLKASVGELFSLLLALLFYLFPDRKLDKPRKGPGILLVHGYLHNTSPWRYFRYALQKRGIGTVNSVFYPSLLNDIPDSALRIKEKIAFLEQNGQTVDAIIGHSQGGLVALEYALELAPKGKTIMVIALGSPLQGTRLAKLALGPSASQILPHSLYLQGLKKKLQMAHHIRFLALASTNDGVILPNENSYWSDLPYQTFDGLGHVQFLFSPRVVDTCVNFLKKEKDKNDTKT